jgi:hypothetical protein
MMLNVPPISFFLFRRGLEGVFKTSAEALNWPGAGSANVRDFWPKRQRRDRAFFVG